MTEATEGTAADAGLGSEESILESSDALDDVRGFVERCHRAEALALPSQENSNATLDSAVGTEITDTPSLGLVARVHDVVRRARTCYRTQTLASLETAEELVQRFAGLPVRFDILSTLRVETSESIYRDVLAWLLRPDETHGLGDQFLRRFLARLGISGRGVIFDFTRQVPAATLRELSWTIPASEDFALINESTVGGSARHQRRLRVDLLVLIPGTIIPIELKVHASESEYRFRDRLWHQAALYGRMFELMLSSLRDASRPKPNLLERTEDGWRSALQEMLASQEVLRQHKQFLQGGDARVVPVLVHPRKCCLTAEQPIGRRKGEHKRMVRHVRWLDIESMVADLVENADIEAPQHNVLQSFRTAILRFAGESDLVDVLEDLRLRVAQPGLVARFPVEYADHLEDALAQIIEIETCARRVTADLDAPSVN